MTDVTRILSAIEEGDPHAAEQLLPLVYDELRQLAAAYLADEKPGQTLQPTALVHEAYLRLVGQLDPFAPAAVPVPALAASVLDEDAAHGFGRRREEVPPAAPVLLSGR